MNATLPRPPHLLHSWSGRKDVLITPPMSSVFQSRVPCVQVVQDSERMTLPPIAHLERLSNLQPLTPPDDLPPPSRLPPPKLEPEDSFQSKSTTDMQCVVDWLDFTRTRSAHFIAEKTCEMICYLWFSASPSERSSPSSTSTPFLPRGSAPSPLQLVASPQFVSFMQKLLETTQVSQSVIVLSLHFIYRLKERNLCTPAQRGSEFRIAVAGLMMANKFLDDNTYTNKTWSEVSGIELEEINRMEREFLLGVDFNLYVDKATYESWLNLLKGLVMAKERDTRHYRKSCRAPTQSRLGNASYHPSSTGPASRTYTTSSGRQRPPQYRTRARSTSPSSRTMSVYQSAPPLTSALPPPHITSQMTSPIPRPGVKRSAQDAFSPTSASFAQLPAKRPVSMSLQIPEYRQSGSTSAKSYSPVDGLQSFSNMSLNSGIPSPMEETSTANVGKHDLVSGSRPTVPETLVAPYSLDEGRRGVVPQNLYFYTLACSPSENASPSQEQRARKARLRYHQPTTQPSYSYSDLNACANGALYAPQTNELPNTSNLAGKSRFLQSDTRTYVAAPMPTVVQSASTSPAMGLAYGVTPTALPHFHDDVWAKPPVPAFSPDTNQTASASHRNGYTYARSAQPRDAKMYAADEQPSVRYSSAESHSSPDTYNSSRVPTTSPLSYHHSSDHHQQMQHHPQRLTVQSAPFANAGPPGVGVQFYPTPHQSAAYPHSHTHNPRHVDANMNGTYPWVRTRY